MTTTNIWHRVLYWWGTSLPHKNWGQIEGEAWKVMGRGVESISQEWLVASTCPNAERTTTICKTFADAQDLADNARCQGHKSIIYQHTIIASHWKQIKE